MNHHLVNSPGVEGVRMGWKGSCVFEHNWFIITFMGFKPVGGDSGRNFLHNKSATVIRNREYSATHSQVLRPECHKVAG